MSFPNVIVGDNDGNLSSIPAYKMIVPKGCVLMWSGSVAQIPTGWTICNGGPPVNGVIIPDLRGRFVLGYNPEKIVGPDVVDPQDTSVKLYTDRSARPVGETGGEEIHTLSIAQMPKHEHTYERRAWGDMPQEGEMGGNSGLNVDTNAKTTQSGDSKPHNNMPPYYVLAYIIKVE